MTTLREASAQAMHTLEVIAQTVGLMNYWADAPREVLGIVQLDRLTGEAIKALQQALAQPESEPVAEVVVQESGRFTINIHLPKLGSERHFPAGTHQLYAAPVQPEDVRKVDTPASDREALIADHQELNMANYSAIEVEELNNWANHAHNMLEADDSEITSLRALLNYEYTGRKAQQVAVPPGYALVPIEPTPEMLGEVDEDVGGHCYSCTKWPASDDDCRRVYAAMLKAAPQPPQREPMTDEEAIRSAIERHMANFPANCKNAAVEVVHAVLAHKGEVK